MNDKLIQQLGAAADDIQPDSAWLERSREHVEIQIKARAACARPRIILPVAAPPRRHWPVWLASSAVAAVFVVAISDTSVPALNALERRSQELFDHVRSIPSGAIQQVHDVLVPPASTTTTTTSVPTEVPETGASSSATQLRERDIEHATHITPAALPAAAFGAQAATPTRTATSGTALPILPPTASATATAAVQKSRPPRPEPALEQRPTTTPAVPAKALEALDKQKNPQKPTSPPGKQR